MNFLGLFSSEKHKMVDLSIKRVKSLEQMKKADERLTRLSSLSKRSENTLKAGDFICTLLAEGDEQIFKCVIDADGGMDKHVHDPSVEIFNVIKGQIEVTVDGKVYKLRSPDTFVVESGLEHSISAKKGSEMIVVLVPPEVVYSRRED